jgi:hypothetical protein
MGKERYKIDEQKCEILDNHFVLTPEDIVDRLNYLEEQLKNAIVPKFNYHQVIYVLCNDEIIKGQIDCFDYYNKKYLIYLMGFGLGNEWCYEYEVFATKEEAETKLKELRGE